MDSIDWANSSGEEVYPGISRQILQGEHQTLVRYVYAPGSRFPLHSHRQEQITAVISGEIEFTVGGETIKLQVGQAAVIPANMPHGARVIGESPVETLNALSPRRDEQPAPVRDTGS
jgi:quercetin dioxygenase-like cupin family protein